MNFCHVHWTGPIKMKRWGFDVELQQEMIAYHYSLSVAYIKRLGETIDLYTDTEGKNLLGHLPYDNIYVVLDDMNSNIQYYNWAAGKIEGIKHMKLGDVYIDGDVFIKSQKCLDKIANGAKYDGFFFGNETPAQEGYTELNIYIEHNLPLYNYEFPMGIPVLGRNACNGGLIMFNNQEYKNKFIEAYTCMLNQIIDNPPNVDNDKEYKICFDLVMEQRFLWEIGQNYNIDFLIDYWNRDPDNIYKLNKQANELGVQHVIGDQKFRLLYKCIDTLKKINPIIYVLTTRRLDTL